MKATVIMNIRDEKPQHFMAAVESYAKQNCDIVISTVEGDPCINRLRGLKIVTLDNPPKRSPIGAYLQLNNALEHIDNEYWCYASSNDVAYPHKIEKEISTLLKHKKKICYSAYDTMTENGRFIATREMHNFNAPKLFRACYISDCAMIHTSLNKYLPFDIKHKNYGYWNFWLTVYRNEGNVFAYNEVPTWSYRLSSNSMHIKRKQDPKLMAEYEADKNRMLNENKLKHYVQNIERNV